jgi:homoserine dehydrogenase
VSEKPIRLVLHGLGSVNCRVLRILRDKSERLREQYGLRPVIVGAVDSQGAAWDPDGLDPQRIIALKSAGHSVAQHPAGQLGARGTDLLGQGGSDVLLEATPLDLKTGQPGLSCIRAALSRGTHVVTANKGPLVLAFQELVQMARSGGAAIGFSATVGGGLPAVNIGQRDLVAASILRLEGVLNLTSHYVLSQMSTGRSLEESLAQAQAEGHAEANPRLDMDGWDAAAKLVILANAVLHQPTTLEDVDITPLTNVTYDTICQMRMERQIIKPLALAEQLPEGGYRLHVAPTPLPLYHPLARLTGHQMAIVYHTDIAGDITTIIDEEDPMPTAAAMVRDLVNIVSGSRGKR